MRNQAQLAIAILLLSLSACKNLTLVQPYDERLVDGTEAFYKVAAAFVENARAASPEQRPATASQGDSGHLSEFESGYANLLVEANALLLRAMVNSSQVDKLGQTAQSKISEFISEQVPTNCQGSSAMLGEEFVSLTVQNFLDLKCLVSHWRVQHEQAPCKGSAQPAICQVLTNGAWQRRQMALTAMVFAIQQAESAKLARQSN